jgi:hypothetical protein
MKFFADDIELEVGYEVRIEANVIQVWDEHGKEIFVKNVTLKREPHDIGNRAARTVYRNVRGRTQIRKYNKHDNLIFYSNGIGYTCEYGYNDKQQMNYFKDNGGIIKDYTPKKVIPKLKLQLIKDLMAKVNVVEGTYEKKAYYEFSPNHRSKFLFDFYYDLKEILEDEDE